jgi:hypothetical protein
MRNVSDKIIGKIKRHVILDKFFSENHVFYEIMQKFVTARQATEDNIMLRGKAQICLPDD